MSTHLATAMLAGVTILACAGSPATPPRTVALEASLLDAASLDRVVATFGHCTGDGTGYELKSVLRQFVGRMRWRPSRAATCLATAHDGCKALDRCLGLSFTSTECGRRDRTCVGSVDESCSGSGATRVRIDCARLSLSCGYEGCVASAPASVCDSESFVPRCDEGRPVVCSGNGHQELFGPRCADYGLRCVQQLDRPFPLAACMGMGPPCSPSAVDPLGFSYEDGLACDGQRLSACVNGRVHTVDCASLMTGSACHRLERAQHGGVVIPGGLPNYQCTLAAECGIDADDSHPPTCEGDSIVLCDAGRFARVSCKELGFDGCASGVCTGGK